MTPGEQAAGLVALEASRLAMIEAGFKTAQIVRFLEIRLRRLTVAGHVALVDGVPTVVLD